jgi:hypothetical protein
MAGCAPRPLATDNRGDCQVGEYEELSFVNLSGREYDRYGTSVIGLYQYLNETPNHHAKERSGRR